MSQVFERSKDVLILPPKTNKNRGSTLIGEILQKQEIFWMSNGNNEAESVAPAMVESNTI